MANSISGKDGKREMICSFCGRSQSQVDQLIIGPGNAGTPCCGFSRAFRR